MKTTVWGPVFWRGMHAIASRYDPLELASFQRFYTVLLPKLIPCTTCRKHYKNIVHSQSFNHSAIFRSRESLTKWVYDLQSAVNTRVNGYLGKPYKAPTLENVRRKYETHAKKHVLEFSTFLVEKSRAKPKLVAHTLLNLSKMLIEK